jgi:hypothetical protein
LDRNNLLIDMMGDVDDDDEGYTCAFHLLSLAIKDGKPGPTRAYYDVWVS